MPFLTFAVLSVYIQINWIRRRLLNLPGFFEVELVHSKVLRPTSELRPLPEQHKISGPRPPLGLRVFPGNNLLKELRLFLVLHLVLELSLILKPTLVLDLRLILELSLILEFNLCPEPTLFQKVSLFLEHRLMLKLRLFPEPHPFQ